MESLMKLPAEGYFFAETFMGTRHVLNRTGRKTTWLRNPGKNSAPSRIDKRFVEVQVVNGWELFQPGMVLITASNYLHVTSPLIRIWESEVHCQNDGQAFDGDGICWLCVMEALL